MFSVLLKIDLLNGYSMHGRRLEVREDRKSFPSSFNSSTQSFHSYDKFESTRSRSRSHDRLDSYSRDKDRYHSEKARERSMERERGRSRERDVRDNSRDREREVGYGGSFDPSYVGYDGGLAKYASGY